MQEAHGNAHRNCPRLQKFGVSSALRAIKWHRFAFRLSPPINSVIGGKVLRWLTSIRSGLRFSYNTVSAFAMRALLLTRVNS